MDQIYITDIKIDHVRHLKNIEIPLSENHMKHLIITGKMGVERRVCWMRWLVIFI